MITKDKEIFLKLLMLYGLNENNIKCNKCGWIGRLEELMIDDLYYDVCPICWISFSE